MTFIWSGVGNSLSIALWTSLYEELDKSSTALLFISTPREATFPKN